MLDLTKYSTDNLEEFKIACLKDLELDHNKYSSDLFDMVITLVVRKDKEDLLMNIYAHMEALANVIKKEK